LLRTELHNLTTGLAFSKKTVNRVNTEVNFSGGRTRQG
jgi:hypothetical protein